MMNLNHFYIFIYMYTLETKKIYISASESANHLEQS